MLSSSSKYALRALKHLGTIPGQFCSIEALSNETSVPGPYLAKIMKALAANDIVVTKKGLKGGVMLPPENGNLTFMDICVALDDPVVRDTCFLSKKRCGGAHPCALHEEWGQLKGKIHGFLTRNKLKS